MAGNKSDLYTQEEVDEGEARNFAKEIGAFFKLTSAVTGIGIDEIFHDIGCKLFNPNYVDNDEILADSGNKNNNDDNNNNNDDNNNNNKVKNEIKEKEKKEEEKEIELKHSNSIKLDPTKAKPSKEKKKCC